MSPCRVPGPTFRVGVWEDRNKKCRRTMEDTHAFLYNFLHTPAFDLAGEATGQKTKSADASGSDVDDMAETDNGYFAIFVGTQEPSRPTGAGKKLHLILEDVIRKNPNLPIPELLDQTFTTVDTQLEKLPLKNSGCTAAVAVLRWEDRVPSSQSCHRLPGHCTGRCKGSRGSVQNRRQIRGGNASGPAEAESAHAKLKSAASRQRVLYTANVGDARIILCGPERPSVSRMITREAMRTRASA